MVVVQDEKVMVLGPTVVVAGGATAVKLVAVMGARPLFSAPKPSDVDVKVPGDWPMSRTEIRIPVPVPVDDTRVA